MTSIYLARKLLSLKKRKFSLQQIQYLNEQNMREMAEIKRALQKINKHRVINTCRLCLKPGAETNIFIIKDINYAEAIKQVLDIEIALHDGKPQNICDECVTTLQKAVELKQVADLAQWRLQLEAEMVSEDDNADDSRNVDAEYDKTIEEYLNLPKCNQCNQICNSNNDCKGCQGTRKKRVRYNNGRKRYICETCGLEAKYIGILKTHMLTHTDRFDYACGYCSYRARDRSSVRIHERRHTGERPYQCGQCGAKFRSASNLASHRRYHQPPAIKCHLCTKSFRFNQILLNHIATQHRDGKPFTCNDCGNSFATRKVLLRHERVVHNRAKMRIGNTPGYIKAQENCDSEEPQENA